MSGWKILAWFPPEGAAEEEVIMHKIDWRWGPWQHTFAFRFSLAATATFLTPSASTLSEVMLSKYLHSDGLTELWHTAKLHAQAPSACSPTCKDQGSATSYMSATTTPVCACESYCFRYLSLLLHLLLSLHSLSLSTFCLHLCLHVQSVQCACYCSLNYLPICAI